MCTSMSCTLPVGVAFDRHGKKLRSITQVRPPNMGKSGPAFSKLCRRILGQVPQQRCKSFRLRSLLPGRVGGSEGVLHAEEGRFIRLFLICIQTVIKLMRGFSPCHKPWTNLRNVKIGSCMFSLEISDSSGYLVSGLQCSLLHSFWPTAFDISVYDTPYPIARDPLARSSNFTNCDPNITRFTGVCCTFFQQVTSAHKCPTTIQSD